MGKLVALVLTYNEELHIERCLKNLFKFADRIVVVDSFSTDSTIDILKSHNIEYYQREWKNYSDQYTYGTSLINENDYVFRIDADEYCDKKLVKSILNIKQNLHAFDGYYLNRYMTFIRKKIKYGGVFPVKVLRVYKNGLGSIETRWMDEHISLKENTSSKILQGHLIDDSLKNLSWWIDKHNSYASREAVDIILQNAGENIGTIANNKLNNQASIKRFLKEKIYNKFPKIAGPIIYFLYRYILRLGFLDGYKGFLFHFYQGFWYRLLVNTKLEEVKEYKKQNNMLSEKEAIKNVLSINLKS